MLECKSHESHIKWSLLVNIKQRILSIKRVNNFNEERNITKDLKCSNSLINKGLKVSCI